ncbi:hypothetical protein GCM10022286_03600 [Gryllotalpicola daejeonensis]|uniref:Nucleoside 2-deoxyribosyltransferase n=1 Tax=Gryllotalpicola daejeonensis TaxID=993087 RepID=A0ABP7ZE80_9MICO
MSDFFVAGSWRNRAAIEGVLLTLDCAGFSSYSFVRAPYSPEASVLAVPGGADSADLDSEAVQELFEQDLAALKAADRFLLVLPAGQAGHIEAGIAYGLGEPCIAVGASDRSDTLYRIFEHMFPSVEQLELWLSES